MALDQAQELANLIRLGLAADVLKVHKLRRVWMYENVMTAADAGKPKAKTVN